MKYIKLEISDNPFDEPKRVLTFGKFKGYTIKEVYDHNTSVNKNGYLEWCMNKLDGFTEELNDYEFKIAKLDYKRYYVSGDGGDYQGYGWLAAEDCDLLCM